MEHITECTNEATGELFEDIKETKLYVPKIEIKIEFNYEEELNSNTEVDANDGKLTIKIEPLDANDEQELTDNSLHHFTALIDKNEINSSGVLGSEENEYPETLTKKIDTTEASRHENTRTKDLNSSDPGNTSCQNFNGNVESLLLNDTKSLKKFHICDVCDKRFHSKSTLLQHILNHPKMYNCTSCTYKASRKSDFERHINSRHTKSTIFTCSYCSHKTYDKHNLNKHINSQHTKRTVFTCPHCNFQSFHGGTLSKHINAKHTKSTVFSCSQCDYKTCYKSNLNKHTNSVHTKSIVFNCSSCSFKTYQKLTLSKHINAKHTKVKVFSCSDCCFKTSYRECLNRHVNTKHSKKTT